MRATAAAILSLVLLSPAAMAKTKEFHSVVPVAPNGRVSVDSHNGSVNVMPWNQPNVGIDARIEPAGGWNNYPSDVEKTNVRVTRSGGDIRIESDYDAVPSHVSLFGINHTLPLVHYTIHVPNSAQLHVTVHNAFIKVSGLRSDVSLLTHNGSIDVADLDGAAKVETHNGSVRIAFVNFARPSRVETHNGSVDVVVPAASRMTIKLRAHVRDPFSTDLPMTVKASGSTTTAAINGGGPEFDFVTHNGSLHLGKR
jgi:hypothetical protein